MTRKTVYVVTGLELGWDCVVGVWDADTVDYEALCKMYNVDPETNETDGYIIHEQTLKANV